MATIQWKIQRVVTIAVPIRMGTLAEVRQSVVMTTHRCIVSKKQDHLSAISTFRSFLLTNLIGDFYRFKKIAFHSF